MPHPAASALQVTFRQPLAIGKHSRNSSRLEVTCQAFDLDLVLCCCRAEAFPGCARRCCFALRILNEEATEGSGVMLALHWGALVVSGFALWNRGQPKRAANRQERSRQSPTSKEKSCTSSSGPETSARRHRRRIHSARACRRSKIGRFRRRRNAQPENEVLRTTARFRGGPAGHRPAEEAQSERGPRARRHAGAGPRCVVHQRHASGRAAERAQDREGGSARRSASRRCCVQRPVP